MLIDFFLKLKSHKLPPSVDDFYYLARTALVKDQRRVHGAATTALRSSAVTAAKQAKWGPIVRAIGFREQN